MQFELIDIKSIVHEDNALGGISVFEGNRDLPFGIKRIYYIHDVAAGQWRGKHAHRTLEQMLFCPYGKIRITLDNGFEKAEILLDRPDKGLIVHPGLWRDMLWEQDNSVLCVAASEYYDENDYIRDYGEFLEFAQKRAENDK